MKYSDLSSKTRFSYHWINVAAAASLLAVALVGCGGGGGDTTAAAPPAGGGGTTTAAPAGVPQGGTNTVAATTATSAAWAALAPQVTVTSVTINSPPVVKFTVKDAAGAPVVGLGNRSKASTATVSGLTNFGFTLAKLVPGSNGAPSKWVNYLMFTPPTVAQKTATPATSSCDAATNATWCGTFPTYDREGTLIDFGDGSYQYTFYRDPTQAATIVASLIDSADGLYKKADAGDLSYAPTLTHRLGIQMGGAAPGTGSNLVDSTTLAPVSGAPATVNMVNPANTLYDFRPDGATVTNTRNIVKIDSCTECHAGKVLNHGSRKDPNYCATCHTDQIKYSFDQGEAPMLADGITFAVQTGTNAVVRPAQAILGGRAVGNLPNMIHKLHMGEDLIKQGYNFNNDGLGLFNERRFPQEQRNCIKCHDGTAGAKNQTADGDNWKNVPSRLACGACHDGINFATGKGITLGNRDTDDAAGNPIGTTATGHIGGAKADDSQCVLCHDSTTIPVYHAVPVATPHSVALIDGVSTFTYDLSSVTLNASKQPVIKFQIKKDGVAVAAFATPTTVVNTSGVTVINPAYEPIAGFAGGPSLYVVYAVPQDGIAAPADFNASSSVALANLLAPATGTTVAKGTNINAGSLTFDAATGYWTATLTNTAPSSSAAALPITVPANAVMVTGAIIGSFTQKNVDGFPYTPAVVATAPTSSASGGVVNKTKLKSLLASGITGNTARRAIVATAKCENCHDQLGTKPEFHGGARNDATACAFCHTPNRTSDGWAANSRTFIHAIHGAGKRTVPYMWAANSADDNFSGILFPGILKNCEASCHLPNTYDMSASQYTSTLFANLLNVTAATGKLNSTASNANAFRVAPSTYVTSDNVTDYGVGFSYNVGTGVTTQAAGTTLVHSPIASVCFACHDTSLDKSHMESNGGSIYATRTVALAKAEQCTLCHLAGKVADIKAMHAK